MSGTPIRFITFEGGEGSGKSTHMNLTKQWLEAKGLTVATTHEPGGTQLGQRIRSAILESSHGTEIVSRAELLLFLADRAQHIEEFIRPKLEEGNVVLCDRFSGSTFAYQVGGRNLKTEDIVPLDEYARAGVSPDIVLYLDIPPELGVQRKHGQGGDEVTKFEREALEFHAAVRANFKEQATQQHWVTIDGSQTLEKAQADIEAVLAQYNWN